MPRKINAADVLKQSEVADLLGVSEVTLARYRMRGDGPTYVKVSNRCVRYLRSDIEAWLVGQRRVSTSDPGPACRKQAVA